MNKKSLAAQGKFCWFFVKFGVQPVAREHETTRQMRFTFFYVI
jgi:hypothetical protein